VVQQRGHQDAGDDGHGFAVARGQQQRQQLRLVADLAQGHHARGHGKGFGDHTGTV
jgi:hypothetical protein